MSATLPNTVQEPPRIFCEKPRPVMAKAELTNSENRRNYGAILKRASEIAGLNRDETATALGANPAQISRWWSGEENAQTWRYNAHPKLGPAYLLAQAEAHERRGAVTVETVVRVAR